MTATFSPLDVLINPVIKAIGKGKFRKICAVRREEERPLEGGTEAYEVACLTAVESFSQITTSTVQKSFTQAIGDLSPSTCEQDYKQREQDKQQRESEKAERCAPFLFEIDQIMNNFNTEMNKIAHI